MITDRDAMVPTISLLPVPLTAVQQYLQDRSRDTSDNKRRLEIAWDADNYGYAKSSSPPSLREELYYHCVGLRKDCLFENDLVKDGSGLNLILEQAQKHAETKDFLNSDLFRTWNTCLSRPWHNDHPPCLCFGTDKSEMCEVCYQTNTNLKRPWYIERLDESYRSASDRVCETCSHIDWLVILRPQWREVYGDNDLRIPLGTLSELQKREHCAVCRLIMATLALRADYPSAMVTAGGENIVGVLVEDRTVHDTARLEIEFKVLPYQYNDDRLIYKIKLHEITVEPKPELGRIVPQDKIDVDVLRQWIAKYDSVRSQLPEKESSSRIMKSIPSFRLIDVVEQRVVERSIEIRFLALSYVWGGRQKFQSTKANQHLLKQQGSLRDAELPQTIQDAIDLVREIGEHYLWVDSLCIVQDDDDHKMIQIRSMDQIYNNAVAIIVCATGENADAGLVGFRAFSRKWTQYTAAIQGLIVANYAEHTDSLEEMYDSKWRSRAWTFQEEMLATRQLTFTSNEVRFESVEGEFSEQFHDPQPEVPHFKQGDETDTGDRRRSQLERRFSSGPAFENYASLISDYSAREMSHSTDGLNAVTGVLTYLEPRFPGGFIFGLPCAYLNTALIWEPFGPVKRRRHPTSRAPIFPSWSWAGWECKVWYNTAQESRAKGILKFFDRKSQCLFSSTDVETFENAGQPEMRRLDRQSEANLNTAVSAAHIDERSEDSCTNPKYSTSSPTTLSPARNHHSFLEDASEYLKISTQQSSLYLVKHRLRRNGLTDGASPTPLIFSPSGHLAGVVYVAPETISQLPTGRYDFIALAECSGEPHEEPSGYWLAHVESRAKRGRVDNAEMPIEEKIQTIYPGLEVDDLNVPDDVAAGQSFFDYGVFEFRERCCLNVMLVEWKEGVAYRLGVGICHVDAFEQGGAVTKDVVLG